MGLVAENVAERAAERSRVTGSDEPAVLAVDEVVARRDGPRLRHDDGLARRHRLEEDGGRPRVAVLEDRQRDDARAGQPAPQVTPSIRALNP